MTLHSLHFASVADAVAASRKPVARNRDKWAEIEHRSDSAEWYGVANLDTAKRLLTAGTWPDGVQRMRDGLGQIESSVRPRSVRRQRVHRDFGAEVDITEYWRGRGDRAWTACKREMRHGPQTVTVAVNLAIRAVDSADRLYWRGAAALALADTLTVAGYNVEIVTVSPVTCIAPGRESLIEVCVKDARAPLDLNALAVTVCLAAFQRYVVHQIRCTLPFKVTSELGHPCAYADLVPNETRRMLLVERNVSDVNSARAWVAAQLVALESASA